VIRREPAIEKRKAKEKRRRGEKRANEKKATVDGAHSDVATWTRETDTTRPQGRREPHHTPPPLNQKRTKKETTR